MIIYVDSDIEADTLAEARAKAADLAEEAWHREVAWQAERKTRPLQPMPFDVTVLQGLWDKKLAEKIARRFEEKYGRR